MKQVPSLNHASRDVAQFGSVPALGAGGRRFESYHLDLVSWQNKAKCQNRVTLAPSFQPKTG